MVGVEPGPFRWQAVTLTIRLTGYLNTTTKIKGNKQSSYLNSSQAGDSQTVSLVHSFVVTVAQRCKFRNEEVVSQVVRRCIFFDVGKLDKLH